MREFIEGNDMQFNDLKKRLEDGRCHKYRNCVLPPCCNKPVCSIGFEKHNNVYKLLIDLGITCAKTNGGISLTQFRQLLSEGEITFLDYTDMKVFLRSLDFLYD